VAEWLDRFAVPFRKRAQRAPHAETNRARVRAHLLMVAVAAQHVSVRVQFFRLAPAPPVRRLELALTRGALVTGGTARNFRFALPAVSSPARKLDTVPKVLPHQLPLLIPFSPRLLSKLNVSPQDTQTSVRVMCVGPRMTMRTKSAERGAVRQLTYLFEIKAPRARRWLVRTARSTAIHSTL